MEAQAWAHHGPWKFRNKLGPWKAQTWAHHGPMRGPSLGPSWALEGPSLGPSRVYGTYLVVHAAPLTVYVSGGMDLGGRNCGPWPLQRKGFLGDNDK
jgi:hypothetical protein